MSKDPEEIPDYKPGAPRRGHPAYKNKGIYVDPHKAPIELDGKKVNITENQLVQEAMQEKLSGLRDGGKASPFTDELEKRVGKGRAKKLVKEMEGKWGFPETGLKGFVKRRFG